MAKKETDGEPWIFFLVSIVCCWHDNRTEIECACVLHVLLRQQHEQSASKRERLGPLRCGEMCKVRVVRLSWIWTLWGSRSARRLYESSRFTLKWIMLVWASSWRVYFLFQLLSVVWNAASSTNLGSNCFTCFAMGWSRGFFRLAVFHWGFYRHSLPLPAIR